MIECSILVIGMTIFMISYLITQSMVYHKALVYLDGFYYAIV